MAKIKVPGAEAVVQPLHPHVPMHEMPIYKNLNTEAVDEALAATVAKAPVGMVLYTDGGCKPSRGHGGWGFHGYMYLDSVPKKGSGNPDVVLTNEGYITKSTEEAFNAHGDPYMPITPQHYVDGWGSFGNVEVTNNIAELTASLRALQYANEHEIDSVTVLTDSEYVQENLDKNVKTWIKRDWLLSTGEPVKNREYWEALVAARKLLVDRGVKVKFSWVKGHNDNLGNEIADTYASVGVILSKRGEIVNEVVTTAPDGYWKYDNERHPMLAHVCCYFNTIATYNDPGFYYLGTRSKDDELFGKRVSDGAFSVVSLARPDPIIEMIRNHQITTADGLDSLMCLRLDQMFKNATHKQLSTWGATLLRQKKNDRLDLMGLDENEPLTREYKPPRIAQRAVEAVSFLADTLDRFVAGDEYIVGTDITDILYETTLKTKKVKGGEDSVTTVQTLRPEYGVGFASMEVEVSFGPPKETRTAKVTLTLGIDLLDRNALNRLAGSKPTVHVITWLESPQAFRYATVIEAGEDRGIWAGVYSNLRVVAK